MRKHQINNPIKYCRECEVQLIPDENWTKSLYIRNSYICKSCNNKICSKWLVSIKGKKYRQSDEYKEGQKKGQKKYAQSEKGRITYAKASKKFIESEKGRESLKGKESQKEGQKKYRESNDGKVAIRKFHAKRKGYDSIELFDNPFDKDIPVVGHHISDAFVVVIPKSLHNSHLHGKYKQLHRDELKPFIEGIYDVSYIVIDGGD